MASGYEDLAAWVGSAGEEGTGGSGHGGATAPGAGEEAVDVDGVGGGEGVRFPAANDDEMKAGGGEGAEEGKATG